MNSFESSGVSWSMAENERDEPKDPFFVFYMYSLLDIIIMSW